MLGFFNRTTSIKDGALTPSTKHDEHPRSLPASWYRSPAMYELERRAIFSKRWIMITHSLRFTQAGDYVAFTEAGFRFFLIKDRQGQIRGFHNICRHRAYPIVTKESGHVSTLCCRYHGWSYGLQGNLAKAPRFETVPTFDKSKHSLLGIHTHIDTRGFVWVNLESSESPTQPWKEDFEGVDTQERHKAVHLNRDYHFDHQWSMEGDYNWKTLIDNYNECYHCPTGHPGVVAVADLTKYYVETKGGHVQHFNTPRYEGDEVNTITSTFLFPNSSMTITPHFFYVQRCIPTSASKTTMEYEVYRHNSASDKDFQEITSFYRQVLKEDKDLCNAAQRNLDAGIFVTGQLHPEKEKGTIFLQQKIRKLVMDHRVLEEQENSGAPIWPASAAPSLEMKTVAYEEQESFCAGLDAAGCPGAAAADTGALAW